MERADNEKKLDNTTSQDTRLALVLHMCALFINLMLELDDSLSQGSFSKDFMNDFNLLIRKVAQSKKNNRIIDSRFITVDFPIELPIESLTKLPTKLPIPTINPITPHSRI